MAIKINGTTVINDSRTLQNIGGLKTVNGTSIVGSGNISAGASTTAGAVGTYMAAKYNGSPAPGTADYNPKNPGDTLAGSKLRDCSFGSRIPSSGTLSGTWRAMGYMSAPNGNDWNSTLWIRIS